MTAADTGRIAPSPMPRVWRNLGRNLGRGLVVAALVAACTGDDSAPEPNSSATATNPSQPAASPPATDPTGVADASTMTTVEPSLSVDGSGLSARLVSTALDAPRASFMVEVLNATDGPVTFDLGDPTTVAYGQGELVPGDAVAIEPAGLVVVTIVVDGLSADDQAGGRLKVRADSSSTLVLDVSGTPTGPDVPVASRSGAPRSVAAVSLVTTTTPDARSTVAMDGVEAESSAEVRAAEIVSDFDGREVDDGTILTVPSEVLFDVDESVLRPDARASLDDIVEVLAFYDDAPAQVTGHTDATDTDDYNQALSEDRAASVAAFLVDAGIARGRLAVEGRGESEPRATNDTEQGRQRNRRVEILLEGVTPPG